MEVVKLLEFFDNLPNIKKINGDLGIQNVLLTSVAMIFRLYIRDIQK